MRSALTAPEAELELVRARIVDGPKDLFELVALMADELHNYNAILLTEAPETNAVLTLLHDSGCEACDGFVGSNDNRQYVGFRDTRLQKPIGNQKPERRSLA